MKKFVVWFLCIGAISPVWAQDVSYPSSFDEPMPIYTKALGDFGYAISSKNPEAQAYFDQGFQMMYAFAKEDAARSFRESSKKDPNCAICYWGEAWAWGSYLNGAMTNAEAPRAYAAMQKAQELADYYATTKEKDLINALSVRYVQNYDRDNRALQDTAYALAMEKVYKKYPNDLDIATLYADALFLLEPRRGERDINDPDIKYLHSILEGILEKDIKHTGACHLYIHATESTQKPELAEGCAEFIGSSIPGASHINHMPSHTWNEIGRWNDAVRANIMAWHSDQKAAVGEGFAIYPSHNLHMLLFAASMDGQGGVAIQAGKDYAKLTGNNMYHVLTLVRFGRFDEIAAIDQRPSHDVHGGMWDFAQGYAALKEGDINKAKEHLSEVQELAETSTARFRFHDADNLLGTVAGILEGEIAWVEGDMDAAIAAFRKGTEFYDRLTYDEPEPMPFSPRHWLGAAYIEIGEYNNAVNTYRRELVHHPHNGWSLFGIKQAIEAAGNTDERINAEFERSWARSDTWIRGSKF